MDSQYQHPKLLSEAAAAMAAASLFFKDKVQDIDYSNTLYLHAQQLYDFASINHLPDKQHLICV
ncbi:hypothetical protein RhiirA4_451869 [Rhizophagus irregularis]|uniref:cellulase n=1 Tax=Rhizophagus irregularis TaxID=588596 RepID=A0A2I1FWN8_9GLOM|nr:hypothetical protein RhiirA4_451869 [Rhizophagus irregularis]